MESDSPERIQKRNTQIMMQFNEGIFKRNVLTDVECVVEGQIFKTHRTLLVYFSPYLKKKLLNTEGEPISKRIQIPKIGANEFEILLRYMYNGTMEVDCNNILNVYKAISILEMEDAKVKYLQLISGKDEIRTYFYTYVLCKELGMQQQWQKAFQLITHRFEETVFSKEFMQLNLNCMIEILTAQTIGARSEIIVFLAALNWLNYDFGSRGIHAVTVMECVRFSSMSMEEIVACYHPPFLSNVVQIPEVTMMLHRATCYLAAKSQGQENWFKHFASPKRNLTFESLPMELWHKRIFTVSTTVENEVVDFSKLSGYHDEVEQKDTEAASLGSGTFDSILSRDDTSNVKLPLKKPGVQYELDNSKILHLRKGPNRYYSESKIKQKTECTEGEKIAHVVEKIVTPNEVSLEKRESENFEETESVTVTLTKYLNEKKSMKDKSVATVDAKVEENEYEQSIPQQAEVKSPEASVRGYILIVGGVNPKNFTKEDGRDVLILNLNTNTFVPYTNIPETRHNHCAECIDNYLYVIGGCNSQETIENNRYVAKRSCFKLNLKSTKWSTLPEMQCARYDHGSAVYNKEIYVIGGQDESGRLLKSVEIYNPKWKRWRMMNSNMCCGRKSAGITVYANRIWIVGGLIETEKRGQFKAVSHVDLYDPQEKKWYFNIYSIPEARCFCSLAVWDNKLYCIGGMIQMDDGKARPTNEVLFVDSENELWKSGPDLPEPRMGGVAVIHGTNLYFLGGFDPDGNSNVQDVLFLMPGATTWSIGVQLNSVYFGMCAISFHGKLT